MHGSAWPVRPVPRVARRGGYVDFEQYLREYRQKWDVSTANGSIPIVEGARASLSPAFDDADHAYIENGPAMRAVGIDCEKADGKTFI